VLRFIEVVFFHSVMISHFRNVPQYGKYLSQGSKTLLLLQLFHKHQSTSTITANLLFQSNITQFLSSTYSMSKIMILSAMLPMWHPSPHMANM